MLIAFLLILILLVNDDKVESYVGAVIVWNTLCFVLTEVLSFFECISPKSITMSWTCIDLVLVGVVVFRGVRFGKKDFIGSIKASIDKKSIIFFAFSFVMLIFAIKTVPYNYDSMTYHLPRIYHWFQNGTRRLGFLWRSQPGTPAPPRQAPSSMYSPPAWNFSVSDRAAQSARRLPPSPPGSGGRRFRLSYKNPFQTSSSIRSIRNTFSVSTSGHAKTAVPFSCPGISPPYRRISI